MPIRSRLVEGDICTELDEVGGLANAKGKNKAGVAGIRVRKMNGRFPSFFTAGIFEQQAWVGVVALFERCGNDGSGYYGNARSGIAQRFHQPYSCLQKYLLIKTSYF